MNQPAESCDEGISEGEAILYSVGKEKELSEIPFVLDTDVGGPLRVPHDYLVSGDAVHPSPTPNGFVVFATLWNGLASELRP